MERYQELLAEMDRSFKTADHLTYVTYRLVNELKLLMNILENLDKSLKAGMNALLEYDRLYKRIGPLPTEFTLRFEVFQRKLVPRYKINPEILDLIESLHDIVTYKKKSPMVFQRKDKYVISNDRFRLKTVTINDVKNYLEKAKPFISRVRNILHRQDNVAT